MLSCTQKSFCESWDYPPVRLDDGTLLTEEQVKALIRWYRVDGQLHEDDQAVCVCKVGGLVA